MILDFKARLGNRCRVFPGNAHKCASILDFRPKLENRCRKTLEKTLQRASILDFRSRLGNRCRETPGNDLDAEGRCARLQLIVVAAKKNVPPSE